MQRIDCTDWGRSQFIEFYTQVWGVPVIPIGEDKRALVKWTEYQNRLPTQDELDKWFVKGNPWGLAVVCGAVAHNLFSLDIDTPQLFKELKEAGAFPKNACIYKSAKGYHVIMRADIIPYCVKEHNPLLPVELWEFGISGDRSLSIMPDTPQREWVALYDEPPTVDYEAWLKRYIDYSRDLTKPGQDIYMLCPFHKETKESCSINPEMGVYHCLGCDARGKIADLLAYCTQIGHLIPDRVYKALSKGLDSLPIVPLSGTDEYEPEAIIEGFLEEGEDAKAIISGVSGIGKTRLGLSIAIRLSQGKDVLDKLPVPRARRVAYANPEQRGRSIRRVIQQMMEFTGEAGHLTLIDFMGRKFREEQDRQLLWNTLTLDKTEVLILDSIMAGIWNYNDIEEAEIMRQFLSRIVEELKCAVIILHHTSSGEGGGVGAERAKGTVGKMLVAWCATKLLYHSLEPKQDYVGRLSGETRAWGIVDWAIAYEDISKTAWIIDWQDIQVTTEERKAMGVPLIVSRLNQALLFASRLGKTQQDCADEIDVDVRALRRWLSRERYPEKESKEKIARWIDNLAKEECRTLARAGPLPSESVSTENTPQKAPYLGSCPNEASSPVSKPHSMKLHKLENQDNDNLHSTKLEQAEPACAKCPLKGRPRVEGWGEALNGIMLIGEAPGDDEVKRAKETGEDEPFVGKAGKVLDRLLVKAHIVREDCRLTNTCSCQPPKKNNKNTKPPKKAIDCCRPRLLAELDKYKPEVVILLGDTALSLLPDIGLQRYHGKKLQTPQRIYVPMYHPSAAMHQPSLTPALAADFEALPDMESVKEIGGQYSIGELSPDSYESDLVTIDTETIDGKLLGGAISLKPGSAVYYEADKLISVLKDCPEWRHLLLHHAKFDLPVLADAGYDWHGREIDDTMLLAHCQGYNALALKVLETQELNLTHPEYKQIAVKGSLAGVSLKKVAHYCCQDADATRRLWDYLWEGADERERNLYQTIEKPLLPVLTDMERLGIRMDMDFVRAWDEKLAQEAEPIEAELVKDYKLDDKVLSSPKQLGAWLKSEGVDLPKTEASEQDATGKRVLASFIDAHPVIRLILRRRQIATLRSTYTHAYLTLTDENSLLHTQYNQARVVTGRLSSSHPNLQNLPYIFDARRPFIARDGHKLLSMDYSQIDMRVLAVITQDKGLLDAFLRGEDIHNWMSDQLFGNHDPMNRHIIKGASYQVLYGGSAHGLYIQLQAPMGEFDLDKFGNPPSLDECENIMEEYYTRFPGIRDYQEASKTFALKHGYIDEYYGRRRYFPKLGSPNRKVREKALREVINMPIAGTAANIFKISIIKAGAVWTPVLNVHDELVFDVPEDRIDELAPKLQAAMLDIDFPIPLVVHYNVGNNLGELF